MTVLPQQKILEVVFFCLLMTRILRFVAVRVLVNDEDDDVVLQSTFERELAAVFRIRKETVVNKFTW